MSDCVLRRDVRAAAVAHVGLLADHAVEHSIGPMQSTPSNTNAARKTAPILSMFGGIVLTATTVTVATLAAAQSSGTAGRRAASVQVLTPSVTAEEAQARARARVKVSMYSARWCGVCRAARSYLQRQGIHFVEFDVERDAAARKRHRALSPRGSLPTLQIDAQVMEGFSPDGFEALMTAATQSRVGQHETSGPRTFEIRWK